MAPRVLFPPVTPVVPDLVPTLLDPVSDLGNSLPSVTASQADESEPMYVLHRDAPTPQEWPHPQASGAPLLAKPLTQLASCGAETAVRDARIVKEGCASLSRNAIAARRVTATNGVQVITSLPMLVSMTPPRPPRAPAAGEIRLSNKWLTTSSRRC